MQNKIHPTALLIMRIMFTFFLIATIVFIFSNSAEIGDLSSNRSEKATAIINKVILKVDENASLSQGTVRKLGHFAEYFLLGFWLMLTLRVYTSRLLAFISWPLLCGLLTAVMDEFFQTMIPGRSGKITDVIIDFSGVVIGLCVALFLQLLCGAIFAAFRRKNY